MPFEYQLLKYTNFDILKFSRKTKDFSAGLLEITKEFVGLIPQSLVLRSIVLS